LASVERHYAELFEEAPTLSGPGNLVFTGAEDDVETLRTLARLGFADPPRVAAMVRGWHHGHMRATRSQRAREILTELVPELLRIFGATANPDAALLRFAHFLSRLTAGARDFQDTLDILRRWANERRFQIGVQLLRRDIEGARTGMALADIAETALAALLPAVTAEFSRAHGAMPGGAFVVVALGRLGSREMSLASDLDLILIYEAPEDSPGSEGPRPLAVSTYYGRLGPRLISAITAPTGEGKLYEVDMRLRPSGDSGPIASSLAAFAQYQRESAWSWEHMALTRARPIAG